MLDTDAIINAAGSHASTLARFERVLLHESKVAPGNGLSASIYIHRLEPHAPSSGLAATSARLELTVRVAMNMLYEPQDAIDPKVLGGAVDALFNAYTGDFTLGDLVHKVDLLGDDGRGLSAQFGYLEQDSRLYRIADIHLPLIINDVWSQAP